MLAAIEIGQLFNLRLWKPPPWRLARHGDDFQSLP
jgi:hypothetical protein